MVGLFILLILITNGYLLYFIFNQTSRTFLDWLVGLDSFLCLGNVMTLIGMVKRVVVRNISLFCIFLLEGLIIPLGSAPLTIFVMSHVAYFINICNRLLSCGIVLYRYVFVLRPFLVQSPGQRWSFSTLILSSILTISLALTLWSIRFKDHNLQVLSRFQFC